MSDCESYCQILKAIGPEVNLSYQSSLLKHPTRRQNFANTLEPHCAHYLTLRPTKTTVETWFMNLHKADFFQGHYQTLKKPLKPLPELAWG